PTPGSAMSQAEAALAAWTQAFAAALAQPDPAAAAALFGPDCYWRDLLAFTWTIRTAEGRDAIRDRVATRAALTGAHAWRVDGATPMEGGVEGWLRFETATAHCRAHVRLRGGTCWTL